MVPPSPPAIVWQQPALPAAGQSAAITCDESGVIHCDIVETVSATKSIEDLRLIAKYISLVSERNRRFFIAWRQKPPSAAYEVVRRIHAFPYLPYGDMYAITDMRLILREDDNTIEVRYLRKPEDRTSEVVDEDFVVYRANLAKFMKEIEKEIGKLKKYEK